MVSVSAEVVKKLKARHKGNTRKYSKEGLPEGFLRQFGNNLAVRRCLVCDRDFASEGFGNRICKRCTLLK